MKYRLLGKTGLKVSELCLGTMTFGEDWGSGTDKNQSRKIFDTFAEAGGNFLDTANIYTNGTSEEFLGDFLVGERGRFVLGSKYTFSLNSNDPNAGGNHRKSLFENIHTSLARLKTDYLDILWVHAWDQTTPVEEMMRALDDLIRQGKVLYLGISDSPAWVVSYANALAEAKGWTPFSAIQVEYSLLQRESERELLPMSRHQNLAVTAWSPLGQGVLSGKYNHEVPKGSRHSEGGPWAEKYLAEANLKIAREMTKIADEIGKSSAQVALNWALNSPQGNIIPIIGARKEAHIKDNLQCCQWEMNEATRQRLNQISEISYGFPHDFLTSEAVQGLMYGESFRP